MSRNAKANWVKGEGREEVWVPGRMSALSYLKKGCSPLTAFTYCVRRTVPEILSSYYSLFSN